jgi:hypothetical protein
LSVLDLLFCEGKNARRILSAGAWLRAFLSIFPNYGNGKMPGLSHLGLWLLRGINNRKTFFYILFHSFSFLLQQLQMF